MDEMTTTLYDVEAIRADFPILSREVHGKPLVYLDSAASAQKPRQVMDALMLAYTDTYSNVHRGLHFLSEASTDAYEAVRGSVASFIGAASGDEIVFTSGATMALNLIARCWAEPRLQPGDEILISIAEHHANIVPWQMACERSGVGCAVSVNCCCLVSPAVNLASLFASLVLSCLPCFSLPCLFVTCPGNIVQMRPYCCELIIQSCMFNVNVLM